MADISQITTLDGTTYNIKDATARDNMLPSVTTSDNGKVLKVSSGAWAVDFDGMFIASYGSTTYAEILTAYQNNKVVYCRASSNSNPGTGNQLRMAFLAYVNNQTTPTEFEFQYYRSVATHSDSQQGDQVYVYKVNSSGTWSVTTREAYTKIVAGTGLSSSYSSGTLTITNAQAGLPAVTSSDNGKVLRVVDGAWAVVELPSASGVSF